MSFVLGGLHLTLLMGMVMGSGIAETFYERECQERAPPRLDAKPCWAWHSAPPWLD